MSNNYLLLKVTVLEHVSASNACRIAEDILTVICDEAGVVIAPSPTPTVTPTVTPTPTPVGTFDSSITIAGTNTTIATYSTDGLTFTSTGGATIYFDKKDASATMGVMSVRKGNTQNSQEIARIVFVDTYLNSRFRLNVGGVNYSGTFINGNTYFA